MAVRTKQLVNNGNEHAAPLSHLCARLIRDSEYSHDDMGVRACALSHIRASLKLYAG